MYAGFFPRMVAYMIDSLIAFIVGGIIKAPFGLAAGAGLTALKSNFIFQYSFLDVIGYLGMVSYFVLMTYLTHTTLGKILLRLEVVTRDGEWTFLNILYRETIGRFLSDILCVGYLSVIVTEKKQGFHDMLCDTFVVYKDMESAVIKENAKFEAAENTQVVNEGTAVTEDAQEINEGTAVMYDKQVINEETSVTKNPQIENGETAEIDGMQVENEKTAMTDVSE